MQTHPIEPLAALREVGRILGLSRTALYRRIASGELTVVRLSRKRVVVEPQTLRDYIAARRSTGTRDNTGPAGAGPSVGNPAGSGGEDVPEL